MRLIVAKCEVRYTGRLSTVLPEALRLLMLKSDGSVMVHADTGGFKPQNWMTPPTVIEEMVWPEVEGSYRRLRARPTLIAAGLAALGIGGGLLARRRRKR